MSSSSPPPPEILIVPFFGQGHLLPCMELCKHIAARNLRATLVISSNLSSSIPASLRHHHPLLQITEIPSSPLPPAEPGSDPMEAHRAHHSQMAQGLENILAPPRPDDPSPDRPVCAVLDVMMGWSAEIFAKYKIPTVGFFTSGACSAAMELAVWKGKVEDLKPGETCPLPGLPEDMALTASDLKRHPRGGPPHLRGGPRGGRGGGGRAPNSGSGPSSPMGVFGPKFMGPPEPGQQPPWVDESGSWIAILFHTCAELEGPFLDYLTRQVSKPVWGVGPLLPEQYWKSAGSLLHDREIRPNRQSSATEDEVIQWLDSKTQGSVLYVSFGSEVGPTAEEYPELAAALEESTRPFIWAIQYGAGRRGPPRTFLGGTPDSDEGYFPHGLDKKVGERGLIIRGWAPQLLILSHPSSGGFLSHCGWNSTVEAIGRGVPFLTWPIRGDQYYISKLVVDHLKIGHNVSDDMSKGVTRDDIGKGIERLMTDAGARERAAIIRTVFEHGFPASSAAALDAFRDFMISVYLS
ncbi:scopoletin glucosyltransferase-like [Rhodamnia argentea]|uniref:Scopoletin glucosyltransferase-like n=1 Tax=Rhodamnia argentea TaxID=178133 RepID=A0A8B8R5F5_9MYRT|nr:scopoletin glucosyltransferase-like [Rhodamnia argentea]